MSELKVPSYVLNDGSDLPAVGFGTYGLRGSGGVDALVSAVRNGYRLLDSAFNYENEGILGEAVRRCGVARGELRLVSKLPGRCQHYDRAVATVEESLLRAGLETLVRVESARRLAALGGSDRTASAAPRRRTASQ